MKLRSALMAAPLALILAPPLLAAPATSEGAARITAAFDRYTGGLPGLITVVPVGETYRLSADAMPLLRLVVDFLETLPDDPADAGDDSADANSDPAQPGDLGQKIMRALRFDPLVFELTEQGGGRWIVRQKQDWQVKLDMPGVIDLHYSYPITMDAVWDEALLDFSRFHSTVTASKGVRQQYDDGKLLATIEGTTASAVTESSAAPGANGGVDRQSRSVLADHKQSYNIHYGETGPDAINGTFAVNVAVGEYGSEFTTTGLRNRELADLWTWLVAQRSMENIVARQEELRARLRAVLPLMDRTRVAMPVKGFSLDSALFEMALDKLRAEFETTGLASDGEMRFALEIEGLTPPRMMMIEPWSVPLVPDRLTFDMKLSQMDPGALARLIVDDFDLTAEDPFAGVTQQAAQAALLPQGALRIELAPGEIVADDYRVTWFGNIDIGPDQEPTGAIRFEATGLDTVERKLSEAVGPTARDTLAQLRTLRAMAEKRDGRDLWTIDAAMLADAGAAGGSER